MGKRYSQLLSAVRKYRFHFFFSLVALVMFAALAALGIRWAVKSHHAVSTPEADARSQSMLRKQNRAAYLRPSFVERLEPRVVLDTEIGTVTMPSDGYLSAGVYDSNQRLVRTLYAYSRQDAGAIPLIWDGRDDVGRIVSTTGSYSWKALISQAQVVDTGGVGDSLFSPTKTWTNTPEYVEMNEKIRVVATGPDNSVYLISRQEELGLTMLKFTQDGTAVWQQAAVNESAAATVDSQYIYVSGVTEIVPNTIPKTYRNEIHFYSPATGAEVGAPIFLNLNFPTSIPAGYTWPTVEQQRMMVGIMGLATDSQRLYVSNYLTNSVDIFDKNTRAPLGTSYPGGTGYKPMGIAVHPTTGNIWVANRGNEVTEYSFNGTTLTPTGKKIVGPTNPLVDPGGIDFGGSNNYLYIAEAGVPGITTPVNKVVKYDTSTATPTLVSSVGSAYTHGTVTDSSFTFINGENGLFGSIAVDNSGYLSVVDYQRLQRFNTNGAQATLLQSPVDIHNGSWVGQYSGGPGDAYGFHTMQVGGVTHTLHYLLDSSQGQSNQVYEVDPEYTDGPRAGWVGNGSWRVVERYPTVDGQAYRRKLWDASMNSGAGGWRDFIFSLPIRVKPDEFNVIAYAINSSNGSLRRAAIVGAGWRGVSRLEDHDGGRYVWTDTNANGLIEWGGLGHNTPDIPTGAPDGEVQWFYNKDVATGLGGANGWVDDDGNIWLNEINGDLVMIPLSGFNQTTGNPLYSWSSKVTKVANNPDLQIKLTRVDPNGDIYALSSYPGPVGLSTVFVGNHVARYDRIAGNLISAAATPDVQFVSVAYLDDEADEDPDYYFAGGGVGNQHILSVYRDDGLLVARGVMGAANGYGTGGHNDYAYGLTAFRDTSGKVYAYVQDVHIGQDVRYRIDNLDGVTSLTGSNFTWGQVPLVNSGYWTFDSNLTDLSGGNNGIFNSSNGGAAGYTAGKIGNAIDLGAADGVNPNDFVRIMDAGNPTAYTITAWVKPTDVTNVNVIYRGNNTEDDPDPNVLNSSA
jgi:hypothetical protein